MARSIILLFDGTSNQITAERSNVLRLYGCLERSERQIVWYDPGVGTFGSRDGSAVMSTLRTLRGLAFASGLEDNVLEAYRFLVETWQEGDTISLFGFSRGAYTARVLAGFIHAIGLLHPAQLNMIEYAYRAYQRVPVSAGSGSFIRQRRANSADELTLYQNALRPRQAKIRFLGLWDTVSSYFDLRAKRWSTHPFTDANPDVEIVRHALAIDERRVMFRPQRWRTELGVPLPGNTVQDVKEVWFAGSHSDVGGGYTEAESALAKIPLVWMLDEARAAGLHLDDETIHTIVLGENPDRPKYVRPDGAALSKASMTKGWRLVELFALVFEKRPDGQKVLRYRPFGRRRIEDDDLIHESAVTRRAQSPVYNPPNWPSRFQMEKNTGQR